MPMSEPDLTADLRMRRLREARDENFAHDAFAAGQIEGLTASRLSALSTCARRFAFDHIFGPDDRGELDFDPDPRRRGNLLHKTFELAGLRGFPELKREEVEALLDEARDELEGRGRQAPAKLGSFQIVRDEAHWPGLRARLARSVLRMLHNERERQAQEPRLKPLGFETKFGGLICDVAFKGVIDRIDADVTEIQEKCRTGAEDLKLRAVVIDYKSSTPAASFKNWARDKHWQLLVYVLALEGGLIELENLRLREVDATTSEMKKQALPPGTRFRAVGAYYHDGKSMKRSGGLRLEDEASDLFDFTQNSRTKQTRGELDQALSELHAAFLRVAEILRDGKFFPLREADPACDHCGWRTACRAPHLKA
jgi:RecB family exonuclease